MEIVPGYWIQREKAWARSSKNYDGQRRSLSVDYSETDFCSRPSRRVADIKQCESKQATNMSSCADSGRGESTPGDTDKIENETKDSFDQQLAFPKHPTHFKWGLDLENALAIRDVEYPRCPDNPEQRVFDDMLRCLP
ncbi:hypothetical protein TNCV_2314721 [Trichonephila clavipes]|nr:hypothetical protein TNCV_2314721 [Trichonephila clavipes]